MTTQKHSYGWKRQQPDQRDYQFKLSAAPATDLPKSVDLRPAMPPVYDQGDLGSCTANSASAALWYAESIKQGSKSVALPSRLFIYYNERSIEHTTRQDSGASIRDSMKAVATYGACSETEWPYNVAKFAKKPGVALYTSAKKEALVTAYLAVSQTQTAMMQALAQGLPICVGATLYESFESDEVARTGVVPMPSHTEQPLGGHAFLVVGYDMAKGLFTCRNSWGDAWGDKGYFYIPFSYLLNPNLAADFWIIKTV